MPLLYNDPDHWRKQADEARDLARRITDVVGKAAMLQIADQYDRLAARAGERLAESVRPGSG